MEKIDSEAIQYYSSTAFLPHATKLQREILYPMMLSTVGQ